MKRLIFEIILVVTILSLCYFLYREYNKPREVSQIEQVAKDKVNTEVKDVIKKIDEKGFEHAVFDKMQNIINDVSQLTDSSIKEIDSLRIQLRIKNKQLTEWRQYAITMRDSFAVASIESDTSYRYHNKWANIEFVTPKNKTDKSYFNYTYNAEVNHAEYWRKKNFLSPKRQYIDFWLNDSTATINSVKRIRIEPKERVRFEVNAIALHNKNISTGLEGSFKKGRIQLGAGYMYDINEKQWQPIFIGKFSLFEF